MKREAKSVTDVPTGTSEIRGTRARAPIGALRLSVLILASLSPYSPLRAQGSGPASVLTQHNDNARTGANLNEAILTTSNVNVNQFGRLFSRVVDGQIYAQPLYVPGVTIGQGIHNVVYVATMTNNLYAFDADDPAASAPLWQVNLGPPVPVADVGETGDINPWIGITSTPVIDVASGILYCVAKTKEGTSYVQRLHALDITSGQERLGGPVVIDGSVPGTGDDSVAGIIRFNPLRHLNRPALLLSNGYLYVAFGSHGDQRPYHGWVFSYSAATLQNVARLNVTTSGWGGGIWSSGQGLAADDSGAIYFMTANGTFNMNTGGPSCSSCFIKLSSATLTLMDWFAPYNQNYLNVNNWELNSSGPLVLPGTNFIVGGGKEGKLYLLDRSNMGHFQAGSDSQIVQEVQITYGDPLHGSPIYWNSPQHGPLVFVWYENDHLKAFNLINGRFQNNIDPNTGLSEPIAMSTMATADEGGMLSISANGSATGTGIVWANHGPGIFRAFDASNVSIELWNSQQNATRDGLGNVAKFTPPTIANGKVYLATFSNQLLVYGLLGTSAPPTVGSVFPASGPTSGGTGVTINGTNFAAGATVTLGGNAATGVSVVNSTTITATTPAHAAGAVSVTVTNPNGQSGTLASGFTYTASAPAPTVSSVAPASGPTGGGTAVTITGANFVSGATVSFGGTAATGVSVTNSTTINATTPAHAAGAVAVTVTNPDAQSGTLAGGFTYIGPAPTVSSVAPTSGPTTGGTAATITGANFVSGATVSFDGSAATGVSVVNSTTIKATTPAHAAGAVNVTVTNPDGQTGTLASGFTYTVPAPSVTSIAPSSGPIAGGTAVTITGANFVSGATVSFGGSAATGVSVVNSTTINATTPAHAAGAVSVTVTNPDAQNGTLANGFTYLGPAPTVSSVAPTSGPSTGGTAVTITGTSFATGATVTVGGSAATGVTVVNSTTITATTPAHAAGAVSVTVTNTDGQSGTLPSAFTYTGGAISFVQVAAATPQSPSGTVQVTYPGAQTAGDLNIVVVGWNDTTATVQSVQDSARNMYSLAIGPTNGTSLRQSIYYAKNIIGGANTVTVTFSQPATFADVRVLEYRGVFTLDVTAGASGSGTSCNSGSAQTTAANELIFGANTVSTDTKAPGTGFTSRILTYIDSDMAEDRIVNTTGTYSATATLGTSGNWVMQMVTFK